MMYPFRNWLGALDEFSLYIQFYLWTFALIIAFLFLFDDSEDDDEGGGGMLQPVYEGNK